MMKYEAALAALYRIFGGHPFTVAEAVVRLGYGGPREWDTDTSVLRAAL